MTIFILIEMFLALYTWLVTGESFGGDSKYWGWAEKMRDKLITLK